MKFVCRPWLCPGRFGDSERRRIRRL